ncbi:MAG: Ig-like domain-containing protein, partial [Myxococcales bacterium]
LTVEVYVDGVRLGSTTSDSSGNWSFSVPASSALTHGAHTATARASDSAGNVSPASAARAFDVDAAAPAAPVITSPAEAAANVSATPTITGTAEANATVEIYVDGALVGTVTADGAGNWSYTLTAQQALAGGAHVVEAQAIDAYGNESPLTAERSFTVGSSSVPVPVITSPADESHVGTATPTLRGTAQPNATVQILVDGVVVGTTVADSAGNWSFTLPSSAALAEGRHRLTATQTVGANTSGASLPVDVNVDTKAPDAPAVTEPAANAELGTSRPAFRGTAEPNATVDVYVDGQKVGSTTADGNGNWTFAPSSDLGEGTHVVHARQTDAAGNTSSASPDVTFRIDTTPPAPPVITSPAAGATVSTTPTITGTAEPGATVVISVDGVVVGTVTAGSDGSWSYTLTAQQALADGPHTVTA